MTVGVCAFGVVVGGGDGVRVEVVTVAGVEVLDSSGVAVAISRIVVSMNSLHVRGCSPSATGGRPPSGA